MVTYHTSNNGGTLVFEFWRGSGLKNRAHLLGEENFLGHMGPNLSLMGAQVLQELNISWNLGDDIKEG